MRTVYDDVPIHDFENDKSISDNRKAACKIDYTDMELHHLDKIYTSAFVHDKKTGAPIAKKPKSIHELVWFLMKSAQALTDEINFLKNKIEILESFRRNMQDNV